MQTDHVLAIDVTYLTQMSIHFLYIIIQVQSYGFGILMCNTTDN